MARFNDAGMDRTDPDLMDFISRHPKILHLAHLRMPGGITVPGIVPAGPGSVKTNRFEPGVSMENDAELLGDFPFKQVQLGADRGERVENGARLGTEYPEVAGNIAGNNPIDGARRISRIAPVGETGDQSVTPFEQRSQCLPKFSVRKGWQIGKQQAPSVLDDWLPVH